MLRYQDRLGPGSTILPQSGSRILRSPAQSPPNRRWASGAPAHRLAPARHLLREPTASLSHLERLCPLVTSASGACT